MPKTNKQCGGEGGIRTRVPGFPDHLISSQRRYNRFGTSPMTTLLKHAYSRCGNL